MQLVLIIDQREQYSNVGKDRVESLARWVQTVRDRGIAVDVRTLQQGDVLWIARSRYYFCQWLLLLTSVLMRLCHLQLHSYNTPRGRAHDGV